MIEHIQHLRFIELKNTSNYVVEMFLVPIKPKRKIELIRVIHPNQSLVLDWHSYKDFNLTDYYFRFVKDR